MAQDNWENVPLYSQGLQSMYMRDDQGKRVIEVTGVLIFYETDFQGGKL